MIDDDGISILKNVGINLVRESQKQLTDTWD